MKGNVRECGGAASKTIQEGRMTYPRVERKPETDPSAYREMLSPMWRKLAVISPIFNSYVDHLITRTYAAHQVLLQNTKLELLLQLSLSLDIIYISLITVNIVINNIFHRLSEDLLFTLFRTLIFVIYILF
jgi:hypothetical protein